MFIVILLCVVCVGALFLPKGQDYDYLRIHIRANSNTSLDQSVKYEIKDTLVDFLTPYLCNVKTKDEAIEIVESLTPSINAKCNKLLRQKGFSYTANVKVNNEYFPTRNYDDVTLESGYYDAVIVELGEAEGDNWWCVMYPPLCFVNKFENNKQIKYKSKIVEWFNRIF